MPDNRNRAFAGAAPTVLAAVAAVALAFPAAAAGQATRVEQPAFDTPIPDYYQPSWQVFLDLKKKANGGARHGFADLPDWTGVWSHGPRHTNFDPKQGPNDPLPANVELTPKYRAMYEKKLADVKRGIEWDPLSYCLPAGYPRWFTEPFLREFIVRPEEVWWINEQQSEVRRIYTDGRGHVPEDEAFPLWEGDSIGFWDGDTLVVHTIRVKAGQYQRSQPDFSDKLSTVEKIRKIDPDTIQDDVTVWDPEGLVKPWHVVNEYYRVTTPHVRIDQWSCEENNNVVKDQTGTTNFILPGEPGYKDPNHLERQAGVNLDAN
jgi:hypothetical protein